MSDTWAALERIVRRVVGDYRYERSWPAVVQQTNADGTVDVLPDDLEIRGLGLQRVEPHTLAPETDLRIEPGTRCLLSFIGGDPRKPSVSAWEYKQRSATVSLAGGSAAVARRGDLVDILLSAATPIAGVAGGTVQVPNGSPPPPTIPTPFVAGTPFTGVATIVAPLRGKIIGGARRVKA